MQKNNQDEIKINHDFIANLRGILDSKFNEFILGNYNHVINFPEFSYSWLLKFKIDEKTRKVVVSNNQNDPDFNEYKLILDFNSFIKEPDLDKFWEVLII